MTSLSNKSLGERFVIDKPLSNSGGTASVYLGHLLEEPEMKVAVKLARTDANGPAHEDILLQHETELLSKRSWRHPGVVRLFPLSCAERPVYCLRATELPDSPYYMVMEYLSGGSLIDNKPKLRNMSFEWKLELFYQILLAVSFLHEKKFAHRDLKPENIVFRRPISATEIPQPVLIDFALASDGNSGSEIIEKSYTLEYAAPERIARGLGTGALSSGDPFPLQGDVWSLGVIFYEILTNKRLLSGTRDAVRTTLITRSFEDAIKGADFGQDEHLRRKAYREKMPLLAKYIRAMLIHDPTQRLTVQDVIYGLETNFHPPFI